MTNAEITKLLMEMHSTIGSMNTKLDALSKDLDSHNQGSMSTKDDVKKLQLEVSRAKGGLLVLFGLGALITAIKQLFQ